MRSKRESNKKKKKSIQRTHIFTLFLLTRGTSTEYTDLNHCAQGRRKRVQDIRVTQVLATPYELIWLGTHMSRGGNYQNNPWSGCGTQLWDSTRSCPMCQGVVPTSKASWLCLISLVTWLANPKWQAKLVTAYPTLIVQ